MARPKKTDGEIKDQRVPLVMAPSELKALDDWMHESRIRSRGEAIRRLCHIGINVLPDIDTFLESSDRAYAHIGDALRSAAGKPDAERLEIYENCLVSAVPDMLQAVIDARGLKGIFQAALHGETIDDALREAVRVLDETLDLSKQILAMSDKATKAEG